ncbi:MAG: rhodanese-like domain-containing protein [Planctomycetales bacterium]
MKSQLCLCALLTFAATNAADRKEGKVTEPKSSILIEPDQLHKKLKAKNIRVVDARSSDDYADGHVPGAIRVDVNDWKKLAVADDGLHDAKGWAENVGSLGITSDTHVVVYGGKITDAARIWWLLKYVGVENASLLNGGWDAWKKADYAVETSTPQMRPTEFNPRFQADRLAEIAAVKKSLKSETVKFVDTRSDDEFQDGRIPGSAQLEWKHLLTDDGLFKTRKQLKELFVKAGISPAHTAVCY